MLEKVVEKIGNFMYYRYCFFIILFFSIVLSITFPHNDNFFFMFVVSVMFLGIGYYNKPSILVILTFLVVLFRYHLVPTADESFFFIHLVAYYLFTFISAGTMLYIQKVKKDSLDLTKSLINALDSRDHYTSNHSANVSRYAVQIAEEMNYSKDFCNVIRTGGLLHDIGKIGIPENILDKPGKLTLGEFNVIKKHPVIGYEMLKHIDGFKKSGILDIVLYHHERYDGKGYPEGLKGNEIPLAARIVGVADAFDAMVSKRVYRNELELNDALNEIRRNKGVQFDPKVVDAFLSLFQEKDTKIDVKKKTS